MIHRTRAGGWPCLSANNWHETLKLLFFVLVSKFLRGISNNSWNTCDFCFPVVQLQSCIGIGIQRNDMHIMDMMWGVWWIEENNHISILTLLGTLRALGSGVGASFWVSPKPSFCPTLYKLQFWRRCFPCDFTGALFCIFTLLTCGRFIEHVALLHVFVLRFDAWLHSVLRP